MSTTIKYVLADEFNQWYIDLVKSDVYFIAGQDSDYIPSINTRVVNQSVCREWPNLDGEMVLMTPGEAARCELKRFFPDTDFRARKQEFRLLDIASPMLFSGNPFHGNLYYLDLQGAYASIYRWLTLDCVWPRGIGELWLFPVARRLWDWKVARNSLVGVTRAHTMTGVKGKYVKEIKFHNPFFNPALWYTIQSALHDIAALALRNGALYIATDCAIFPKERGYKRVVEALESMSFTLHKGQGEGSIRGWGNYHIDGFKSTKRDDRSRHPLNNIASDGRTIKWLEKLINYHSQK